MDLDLLKTFALTEKTEEDLETIIQMTQNLPFVINYNNIDIHRTICTNMRLGEFASEETIFNSDIHKSIDYIIYLGSANLYMCELKDEGKESLRLIKDLKEGDCFGSFDISIMKQNETQIKRIKAIANEYTKVLIFENKQLDPKDKSPLMKTNRDITQRTARTARKPVPSEYDPEIFLFDNPTTINEIIDEVKTKVSEQFKTAKTFPEIINKLTEEKEMQEISEKFPEKREFKEVFNYIDSRYSQSYTETALLDLKLGIVSMKSIDSISKAHKDILASLDELKTKFYDKNNAKNRNLLQLNLDKELKSEEFQEYVYDQLNKDNALDVKLQNKKKNETKIEHNKKQIKKEENLLLNTYYCIYCHTRPRNAISVNCHHLVICEECIKKTKICPRCGVNIDNYHKIFRS